VSFTQADIEAWVATQPECVRAMAARYPVGTKFRLEDGVVWYVIAYRRQHLAGTDEKTDTVQLQISTIDPAVSGTLSFQTRQTICPCCMDRIDDLVVP
jgi:hypothetical protein